MEAAMGTVVVVIGIVLALCVFVACRELVCWYWKINQGIELLTRMDARLHVIATELKRQGGAETVAVAQAVEPTSKQAGA